MCHGIRSYGHCHRHIRCFLLPYIKIKTLILYRDKTFTLIEIKTLTLWR